MEDHIQRPPDKPRLGSIMGHFKLTLMRNFINIPIDFLNTVIIARLLGPEGNGEYAIVMLFSSFLLTFFSFSIGAANIYFINSQTAEIRTVFDFNLIFWLFSSLISALTLFTLYHSPLQIISTRHAHFVIVWLITVSTLIQSLLGSLLQSLQLFSQFNSMILITSILRMTLNLTYFIFFRDISSDIFLHLYAYTQIIISVLIWHQLRRHIPAKVTEWSELVSYGKKSFAFSLSSHANNLASFINDRLDTYIINLKMGATHTGYYHIGSLLAQRLWVISDSMSVIIYPVLSQIYAHEENDKVNITATLGRICLVLTAVLSILLGLIIHPFIYFAFGQAYLPAANTVLALLPGILFGSVGRVLANAIAAAGKPSVNFKISCLSIIISTSLNLLLIPHLQNIGAAMSTSLAWIICTCVWIYSFAHMNRISVRRFITPSYTDMQALYRIIQRLKKS